MLWQKKLNYPFNDFQPSQARIRHIVEEIASSSGTNYPICLEIC